MKKNTCSKCGYTWLPRSPHPVQCPECKSRYWKEKEREKIKAKKG